MTIVSTDGSDIVPTNVDALTMLPGQRVDFVLNATKTSKSYWIHITGLALCAGVPRFTDQVSNKIIIVSLMFVVVITLSRIIVRYRHENELILLRYS